nr:MAG TPA: hypothetical protein [Caudoviricetes sp.]
MIWKSQRREEGITRVVKRFAFFPTRIDDSTICWLKVYNEKQIFLNDGYNMCWEMMERWL